MEFISAESEEGVIYQRMISKDGKIELGIYPVMFGFRVRAGYAGSMSYMIDWCGGNNQTQVELLYSIAKNILEAQGDFKGMPVCSKIKPFFNDQEFIDHIYKLVVQPLILIKLGPLQLDKQNLLKNL